MPPKLLFFPCLAVLICFFRAAVAGEVELNLMETPDRVGTYYMADKENSGEIMGGQDRILSIDERGWPMHVGDWGGEGGAGYMVKYFLLFHLPPLDGRKLTHAALRLFLSQIRHDAAGPMSPAWLFHAGDWPDGSWADDSIFHGLQTLSFGDEETFSEKIPLCSTDDNPGIIELDVTGMIEADYQRSPEPVAVFRMELGDHEQFDITDELQNSYNFWGPDALAAPEKSPTLMLSFE